MNLASKLCRDMSSIALRVLHFSALVYSFIYKTKFVQDFAAIHDVIRSAAFVNELWLNNCVWYLDTMNSTKVQNPWQKLYVSSRNMPTKH